MNSILFYTIGLFSFLFFSKKSLTGPEQLTGTETTAKEYQCLPCGRECDNPVFKQPGNCSSCQMPLVEKSTVKFKTIQPSDICAYLKAHPNVILLDVRTKEEFKGTVEPDFGTLKNAINIPVQVLDEQWTTIKQHKNKEIIVFCSHSHRSPQASYILMQHGFSNVTNMAGGMSVMTGGPCVERSR